MTWSRSKNELRMIVEQQFLVESKCLVKLGVIADLNNTIVYT